MGTETGGTGAEIDNVTELIRGRVAGDTGSVFARGIKLWSHKLSMEVEL